MPRAPRRHRYAGTPTARDAPRYPGAMPARKKRPTAGRPFTVEMPRAARGRAAQGDAWWTDAEGHELRLSNLDKLYWHEEGYTKGDLLNYYFNVSELMLPYLRDRPLTMKRMPDGADGPFFYEKTAPVAHARVDRALQRRERRRQDRGDRVPDGERPRDAAVRREPRLHRDAPAPLALLLGRQPRLPVLRPRPDGGARSRTSWPSRCTARRRSTRSGSRATRRRAARPASRSTSRSSPGTRTTRSRDFVGGVGRMIGRADPEHVTMAWRIADRTGQGLHRPQHEPRGREHLGRLLAPAGAARDASRRRSPGTSSRRASRRRTSGSTTCSSGSTTSATCSCR